MPNDDVFAGLEGIFDSVTEDEVVSVKDLSSPELMDMVHELTQELLEMKEGIYPRSQEARDKHSLRNACQVELRNRKIPI